MHATVDELQCGTHHITALHINAPNANTRSGILKLSKRIVFALIICTFFLWESLPASLMQISLSLGAHPSTKMKSKISGRTRTGCARSLARARVYFHIPSNFSEI